MNFGEAIQQYKQARGQYERGEIPAERFEEIVNSLQLTDGNGQIWQIGVKTGKWYRFDGQNWAEDAPQEFERSSAAVAAQATFVPPPPPVEPENKPTLPSTVAGPGFSPDLIQFQDDFSDPGSGWDDVRTGEDANTYYFEDEYVFLIYLADFYAWANPYKNFTGDVQVEVDARKISGSRYDEFGVLCRYVENSDSTSSYYYFAIAADGLGVIYKVDHDQQSLVISDPPQNRSDVIHPDNQVNRIRADCIGDRLTLYVNGEILTDAIDPSFGSGDVGLRADSESGETEIRFDNFVVYKAGE